MSNRITTQQLHCEVEQVKNDITVIKDNHLAHLSADVEELKESVKENRQFFQDRLDRLDNRIWAVVLLTLGTLLSTIVGIWMM